MLRRSLFKLLPASLLGFFGFNWLKPKPADQCNQWVRDRMREAGVKRELAFPDPITDEMTREDFERGIQEMIGEIPWSVQGQDPQEDLGFPADAKFQIFAGATIGPHHREGVVYAEYDDNPTRCPANLEEHQRYGLWLSAYPDLSKEPEGSIYPRKGEFKINVERQVGTFEELVADYRQKLAAALKLYWEGKPATDPEHQEQELLAAYGPGCRSEGIHRSREAHPQIAEFWKQRKAFDELETYHGIFQGDKAATPYLMQLWAEDCTTYLLALPEKGRRACLESLQRANPTVMQLVKGRLQELRCPTSRDA